MANSIFLDWVQRHERTWGTQNYSGRPSLQHILDSPVVVFWAETKQPQHKVTLHQSLQEIELALTRSLFRLAAQPPQQQIVKIFADQKPVRVKGVKLEFEFTNE
jgi:DNA primase